MSIIFFINLFDTVYCVILTPSAFVTNLTENYVIADAETEEPGNRTTMGAHLNNTQVQMFIQAYDSLWIWLGVNNDGHWFQIQILYFKNISFKYLLEA